MNIINIDENTVLNITVITGSPTPASPLHCLVDYADHFTSGSTMDEGYEGTFVTSTSKTAICSAPASYTRRIIRELTLFNGTGSAVHFALVRTTSGSDYEIVQDAIGNSESWVMSTSSNIGSCIYTAGSGIYIDPNDVVSIKIIGNDNEIPILSGSSLITSGSNINNLLSNVLISGNQIPFGSVSEGQFLELSGGSIIGGTGGSSSGGASSDGWNSLSITGSMVSFDSSGSTAIIKFLGDTSGSIQTGDKFQGITNGSTIYAIFTSASAYISGSTQYTIYTGKNYLMSGSNISSPKFSHTKNPFGFPIDPENWSFSISGSVRQLQSSVTGGYWYNVGGYTIIVPIGIWTGGFHGECYASGTSVNFVNVFSTLSSGSASESNHEFTNFGGFGNNSTAANYYFYGAGKVSSTMSVSSKTTFYLNLMATESGTTIAIHGDNFAWRIKFTSAYL